MRREKIKTCGFRDGSEKTISYSRAYPIFAESGYDVSQVLMTRIVLLRITGASHFGPLLSLVGPTENWTLMAFMQPDGCSAAQDDRK